MLLNWSLHYMNFDKMFEASSISLPKSYKKKIQFSLQPQRHAFRGLQLYRNCLIIIHPNGNWHDTTSFGKIEGLLAAKKNIFVKCVDHKSPNM